MSQEKRPFATGSKPGPDAVDSYLESQGYYRKHVARDASSLFRVVSEHIYDIQNNHSAIRQKCADFIEMNHEEYANEIEKNIFSYVSNLRRPRTHGSLFELRVLAKIFKKNVILFEPTNNLQTTCMSYIQNDSYDSNPPMRIFYSPKDKHFDVIFTMASIERIAECQAIVYEILYTGVFKLPDVAYCTERMLHDQDGESITPLPEDPTKYQNQDGVIVGFDSHKDTNCVLKDPRTCHFHNQENFEEIVEEYKNAVTVINRTDDPGKTKLFKPIDGFLYRKDISCVRQLLDEKITPYPYKAAKALDKNIYRNSEFEIWSEARREEKLKYVFDMNEYNKSDDKWMLHDRRHATYGMKKFYDNQILDESSYLALDDEVKKKYVILDSPTDISKFQNFNYFMPSKDHLELTVMPITTNSNRGGNNFKNRRGGGRYNNFNRQFFSNNSQHHPHGGDNERDGPDHPQESQETGNHFYQQQTQQSEQYDNEQVQTSQSHAVYNPQNQNWTAMNFSSAPTAVPVQVAHYQAAPTFMPPIGYQQILPYGNISVQPPIESTLHSDGSTQTDLMNLLRDSDLNGNKFNTKAQESSDPAGADLPMNDIPTLQFYFNLGVRYFFTSGVHKRLEAVATQMETLEVSGNVDKNKKNLIETDSPSVPTNTPVSSKMTNTGNYQSSNYRYNDNYRSRGRGGGFGTYRTWNNSNNNNNSNVNAKKEIKFNPNAKNVHKNEYKTAIQQNSGDKSSSNTQCTPLSPIPHEASAQIQPLQMPEYPVSIQSQYYQQIPYVQQPHPNVGFIYQTINEDSAPFATYQPYTPQPYPYQTGQFFAPNQQTPYPMYYPVSVSAAPQQQQQQHQDTSAISNDSGVVEQLYPQQTVPYYQYAQTPVPVYYTASLPPPTPQVTQLAPIFSGPTVVQAQSVQETQIQAATTAESITFTQSVENIQQKDSASSTAKVSSKN